MYKRRPGLILSLDARQHWLACDLACCLLTAFLSCPGRSWLWAAQKEIQGMSRKPSSVANRGALSLLSGPICLVA